MDAIKLAVSDGLTLSLIHISVGHRVVQGGDKFKESVIVDKGVEDGIEELCDLAPVHLSLIHI